jgi:hypothetical protein
MDAPLGVKRPLFDRMATTRIERCVQATDDIEGHSEIHVQPGAWVRQRALPSGAASIVGLAWWRLPHAV